MAAPRKTDPAPGQAERRDADRPAIAKPVSPEPDLQALSDKVHKRFAKTIARVAK
jgi:hypothetical protein